MAERFRMTLEGELGSALHTLGPGRTLPLVDRALQVRPDGTAFLPASSLRGRWRAHLERLLMGLDEERLRVCHPPSAEAMCPHGDVSRELPAAAEGYCLACRLFGSAWRQGSLDFGDLEVIDDDAPGRGPVLRSSVALGRHTATAQPGRLFVTETTGLPGRDRPVRLAGSVVGMAERAELGWLLAALALMDHVGGAKARGLGSLALRAGTLTWWEPAGRSWRVEPDPADLVAEALDGLGEEAGRP